MSSKQAGITQKQMNRSYLSSIKRAAVACAAVLMALAAFAIAPAFASGAETITTANLAGAVISGVTPTGTAVFRQGADNSRKLEVEVEHVNLPVGTVLNVLVGGTKIGTITLDSLGAGQIELETERGQTVPVVNTGTSVAVTNQSGANIVAGTFGSAAPTPTPTPGATPTPTATPSPTPTPGATPTPTPVMNEFEAKLSGAAIGGTVPKGEAEFENLGANREFKVRIENVNLPAGTVLDVLVDGTKVGTITVAPSLQRSELKLETENGQTVPAVNSRTRVVVADKSGATIVAGSFSNIPPQTTPNPTPTPAPNSEVRIESRLAGAPINGLTPTGVAKFRSLGGNSKLEVEVEHVNLPVGTILNVFVDGVKVGELTIASTLENEFELETEHGQAVPSVTTASTVVVSNAQGQTILSGVFNTAGIVTQQPNDIDHTTFFVEQQYRDFLGREADDSGLDFWSSEIAKCNGDAACVERSRVNTSGAFFLSIEFQETGYMLYRFNKESFGVMPRRNQFLVDMQAASQGVVVGQLGWEQKLEDNKRRAAETWVERPEFHSQFDGMNDDQFVDALFRNAGVVPAQAERNNLVEGLHSHAETRATVLRKVSDNSEFRRKEQNPAFVLMQYFGYLHRNPDEGADTNMDGFNFWLKKLDDNGGDFHRAEMVRAFIEATEYRHRFEW
ncbi:MAG: hypothetical protein QOE46_1958 [Acidobacteriota bacterium]|jgi:hypothetical protein|nr:hypothetical protein [Acidobacteriota bacterium]